MAYCKRFTDKGLFYLATGKGAAKLVYLDMSGCIQVLGDVWYYTAFLRNGLGLFPTQTLVENIGFDGSGEHCSIVDYEQRLWNSKIELSRKDKINISYYKKTLDFFSEAKKTSQPVEALKSHSALTYFSKIFKKKA